MPIGSIGSWTPSYLTRFLNDWLRRNPLPAQDQLTIKKLTVSGSAKVPAPVSGDNSNNAATTAFVQAAVNAAIGGLTTGVSSVFGRAGAVVAASGDYTAAQVTNAADLSNAGLQTFAGSITTGPGLGGFTGTQTVGTLLNQGVAVVRTFGSAATDVAYTAGITSDTQPRFQWNVSGSMVFGPGGATAPDTTLQRLSAGVLQVLSGLQIGDATNVNAAARLTLGKAESNAATNLPWIQQHNGVGNDLALVSSSSSGTVSMWAGNGTTVGGGSNAMIASFGTDGAKIATTTTQKVGFYGATPVVQASAVGASTGYSAGTTTATFHSDDKYTGNVGTTAYTINGIVAALKNLGLIKS